MLATTSSRGSRLGEIGVQTRGAARAGCSEPHLSRSRSVLSRNLAPAHGFDAGAVDVRRGRVGMDQDEGKPRR